MRPTPPIQTGSSGIHPGGTAAVAWTGRRLVESRRPVAGPAGMPASTRRHVTDGQHGEKREVHRALDVGKASECPCPFVPRRRIPGPAPVLPGPGRHIPSYRDNPGALGGRCAQHSARHFGTCPARVHPGRVLQAQWSPHLEPNRHGTTPRQDPKRAPHRRDQEWHCEDNALDPGEIVLPRGGENAILTPGEIAIQSGSGIYSLRS